MTDAELLELVQEKGPGQLTPAELQVLRDRAAASPELAQSLGDRLAAEAQIAAALNAAQKVARPRRGFDRRRQQLAITCAYGLALGLLCAFCLLVLAAAACLPPLGAHAPRPHRAALVVPKPPAAPAPPAHPAPQAQPLKPNAAPPAAATPPAAAAPPAARPRSVPVAFAAHEEPAAPPPVKAPWEETFQAPPRPFAEMCFDEFEYSRAAPPLKDLQQWLAQVPGVELKFSTKRTRVGECAAFDGTARLLAPLTADSVVRFSLENYDRFRIHCFSGTHGVCLAYYEHRNLTWAAYVSTRAPGSAMKLESIGLCNTDEGCWRRTEMRYGGAFELRWRAGEIILSRGDVIVLRAPLATPPSDVFLEGRATFQGLACLRDTNFPAAEPAEPPSLEFARPAELPFSTQVPAGVRVEKSAGGAIALVAEATHEAATILAPLPNIGPCTLTVRLPEATPGAGLCLASGEGQPQIAVRIMKDRVTEQLAVQVRGLDDGQIIEAPSWRDNLAPRVVPPFWLRITYGAGVLRVAASPDGKHWGEVTDPLRDVVRNVSQVGLFLPAGKTSGAIRLDQISLRKFSALSTPASERLLPQAPEILSAPSWEGWLAAAGNALPPGCARADWQRACILKTLGRGVSSELGAALVHALLDANEARHAPPRDQLLALAAAAELLELNDERTARRFMEHYLRVAEQAAAAGELRPFSLVWPAAMRAPPVPVHHLRPALDPALRTEVLGLAYADRADELAQLARRLKFYHWNEDNPLVAWAEFLSGRRVPGPRAFSSEAPGLRDDWPPIVVEHIDKETFNAQTELRAALESETPADAARVLSQVDPRAAAGLAPAANERQLLLALPTAVSAAVAEYPQLGEAMRRQFAEIAARRVDQAILAGDESSVRQATLQFATTPAVAQAYAWLGDRALVSGKFSQALDAYRRAHAASQPAPAPNLLARERYAAAWVGETVGAAPTAPVTLGEITLSPAEFETLVREAKAKAQASSLLPSAPVIALPATPPPTGYRVERHETVAGEWGDKVSEIPGRALQWGIAPLDRQTCVAVDGPTFCLSTRFQVLAFDAATGKLKWRGPKPGSLAPAYSWALIPHRPLITSQHIYCRVLTPAGPVLGCLNKSTGASVWNYVPAGDGCVVSDPVLVNGELLVLTSPAPEQNERPLRLTRLDPLTGEVLLTQEWLRLTDSWNVRGVAQVTVHEGLIFVTLGGAVICGDTASGQVLWMRRSLTVPSEIDPASLLQAHTPPLLFQNRLYVTQPRVRAVECLEPATGKLVWRKVLPTVHQLVGGAENVLVVQTDAGLLALDPQLGEEKWRYRDSQLRSVISCGGKQGLLGLRWQAAEPDKPEQFLQCVWIDLASGKPQATADLPSLKLEAPSFAPVWATGDRLWGLFGPQAEPRRELIELVPQGKARPAAASPAPN